MSETTAAPPRPGVGAFVQQHKVPLGIAGAAAVAGLALLNRGKADESKPVVSTITTNPQGPGGVPGTGYAGVYDSTGSDVYNALQPQLESIGSYLDRVSKRLDETPIPVPGAPPAAKAPEPTPAAAPAPVPTPAPSSSYNSGYVVQQYAQSTPTWTAGTIVTGYTSDGTPQRTAFDSSDIARAKAGGSLSYMGNDAQLKAALRAQGLI